jgi:signal transduction histidine kinase
MKSFEEKYEYSKRKHKDFLEISKLISHNFDVEVIIAKSLSFIAERLIKRVRIYLLDDRGNLVISQWSGDHEHDLKKGVTVKKKSIVWNTFVKGRALNLTSEKKANDFKHSLHDAINLKAIIPLKHMDNIILKEKIIGVMIIDSGIDKSPISQEEFIYAKEIAMLIGQAIGRANSFKEYKRMRDRLSLIQEERIIVLNTMVHNLRNPITVIGGFTKRFPKIVQSLIRTLDEDKKKVYLDKLLEYSKIIAREEYTIEANINDFVNFLSVTDAEYKIETSEFRLDPLIQDIISNFKPLFEIKNIRLRYPKKDIKICANKEGIFTILSHLIYNAISYSPENSTVSVYTNEDDNKVKFSVKSDTFIPKEHRKHIFDYYYSIGKERGTGLGLPIVKLIVKKHNGTIKLISKMRKDNPPFTRFIIQIPCRGKQENL